jgi:hypothetical protein
LLWQLRCSGFIFTQKDGSDDFVAFNGELGLGNPAAVFKDDELRFGDTGLESCSSEERENET